MRRILVGLRTQRVDHLEKWLSLAGGLAGILGVLLVSQASLGLNGSASLVASMGASAVLLFAVPNGPLSQPWPVMGGHLVSAVIGVACAKLVAQPIFNAALAVSLAIGAMHYLRCIHPPGGATALTAVAGGDAVHALGFHFVVTPVLLNVLVILLIAVLFNFPFPWRRYPAAWARSHHHVTAAGHTTAAVDATHEMAANLDAGHLQAIPEPLHDHAEHASLAVNELYLGGYYCNGAFGTQWQVRQLIDSDTPCITEHTGLTYRVVAGAHRRRTGHATGQEMSDWARYPVYLNENSWQRVAISPQPVMTGDAA